MGVKTTSTTRKPFWLVINPKNNRASLNDIMINLTAEEVVAKLLHSGDNTFDYADDNDWALYDNLAAAERDAHSRMSYLMKHRYSEKTNIGIDLD